MPDYCKPGTSFASAPSDSFVPSPFINNINGSSAKMSGVPPVALDTSGANAEPARIFVLSDIRLYREGLISCLSQRFQRSAILDGDSSDAGLSALFSFRPDLLVLDKTSTKAFEIARMIRQRTLGTTIVACGVEETESEVVACAEAGIAGYVTPDGSDKDLLAAIHHAQRGELRCSPRMAALLFKRVGTLARSRPSETGRLTERERQILGLVKNGMSNKEIARTLQIGTATVKNHVHNILEKMNVERRSQAVARMTVTPTS